MTLCKHVFSVMHAIFYRMVPWMEALHNTVWNLKGWAWLITSRLLGDAILIREHVVFKSQCRFSACLDYHVLIWVQLANAWSEQAQPAMCILVTANTISDRKLRYYWSSVTPDHWHNLVETLSYNLILFLCVSSVINKISYVKVNIDFVFNTLMTFDSTTTESV